MASFFEKISNRINREKAKKQQIQAIDDFFSDRMNQITNSFKWELIDPDVQRKKIKFVADNIFDKVQMLTIWAKTYPEVQRENIEIFRNLIKEIPFILVKEVWKFTDPYVQNELLEMMIEKCITTDRKSLLDKETPKNVTEDSMLSFDLKDLLRDTSIEVQEENNEILNIALDKIRPTDLREIWDNLATNIKEKNIERIINDDSFKYLGRYFLERLDNEFLGKNIEKIVPSLAEFKRNYCSEDSFEKILTNGEIQELWKKIPDNIKEEKFILLLEKLNKNYEDIELIWDLMDEEYKKNNIEELVENNKKTNIELTSYLWNSCGEELQNDKYEIIMKIIKNQKTEANEVFRKTRNSVLNDKRIIDIIELFYPNDNEKEIQKRFNVYKEINSINENLKATIDINILTDKVIDELEMKQLVRITAYPYIQKIISEGVKSGSQAEWEIIKIVCKSDENWILELNNIINNKNKFKELLQNISINDIYQNNNLRKTIYILSQTDNYFNIKNINEIENFEEIRNKKCTEILQGKKVENMSQSFYRLSPTEQMKFALLQLQYGIDLEQAENLIKKYGQEIEKIEYEKINDREKELINKVKNIKEIFYKEKFEIDNIKINDNSFESAISIENECLKMYEKIYNNVLFTTIDKKVNMQDEYILEDGNKELINIIEAPSYEDFYMLVRSEGAYSKEYMEPDSFKDFLNMPNMEYHGNCKSLISNDFLGVARAKGPVFGYTDSQLCIAAPWDIISSKANTSFSISGAKWNLENGIQIVPPREMINATRHGHNEFVSDRIIYDEKTKKICKELPSYVIWLKENPNENNEEREKYKRWRITKKAAAQLNIPIVIIDRPEILKSEIQKWTNDLKIYTGEADNNENISDKKLLEQIILRLENNKCSSKYAKNKIIREDFFNDEQRKIMFKQINKRIEKFKQEDPERYEENLKALIEITDNEIRKEKTSTGREIADVDVKFYKIINEKFKKQLNPNELETSFTEEEEKDIFEVIKNIHFKPYYSGSQYKSKSHSIDHIEKVIYFSSILAKNEGFNRDETRLLMTASAFHDCGRGENDGDEEHAEASAILAGQDLQKNKNEFNILDEDIPVIQAAIHYHEYKEKEIGKIDEDEIERLCNLYGVSNEKKEIVKKISTLLKDADALDRTRFTENGRLDRSYLRSKTAKNEAMINLAQSINNKIAKEKLKYYIDVDEEKALDELKRFKSSYLSINLVSLMEIFKMDKYVFEAGKIEMKKIKESQNHLAK